MPAFEARRKKSATTDFVDATEWLDRRQNVFCNWYFLRKATREFPNLVLLWQCHALPIFFYSLTSTCGV